MTGCQAELPDTEFKVNIKEINGDFVLNKKMKSYKNGFLDFWLPRGKAYTIQFDYDNKVAVSEITTFTGDPTCITTIQLQ